MAKSAPDRILAMARPESPQIGWATAILNWAGHSVDRAMSPEEALRMLVASRYDLLVMAYSSSAEDIETASALLHDPDLRLPTLILLSDDHEFITPPQTRFVPTAFLEPGFSQAEMLRLVEKLKEFRT